MACGLRGRVAGPGDICAIRDAGIAGASVRHCNCRRFAGLWPKRPLLNLVRGSILAVSSLLFFLAVKYMPLADAIAVFFVEPLILTLLSVVFLRETVGWRRISRCLSDLPGH
jgi:drug/metabolite transporter (DMT)-like permease